MPAHKIDFFLSATAGLGPLLNQAACLAGLQQAYSAIGPAQLTKSSQVVLLRDGKLTLSAENGAIAAKLKQMTPGLINQFVARGFEVTAIQVEVQVVTNPPKHAKKSLNISDAGVSSLDRLAENLPESALKKAIRDLAARHRSH